MALRRIVITGAAALALGACAQWVCADNSRRPGGRGSSQAGGNRSAAARPPRAGDVVFHRDFDGVPNGTDAGRLGFTVNATPAQSEWTVVDGRLRGTLHHKPYDGGNITISVPKLERGRLDFRVWLGDRNYRHCGFQASAGTAATCSTRTCSRPTGGTTTL